MEKIIPKIDYSRCTDCGICAAECVHHQRKHPRSHVDHAYEFCDGCLHCYGICPNNAISINGKTPINHQDNFEPDKLISLFKNRRSYRRFTREPVADADLKVLLEAAGYIPSGGNDHRFQITVLTSDTIRTKLLSAIHDYYQQIRKILKNPAAKLLGKWMGDPKVRATLRDPANLKKILHAIELIDGEDDVVFYNAPAVLFFHTDRIMPTAHEDCILSAYNVVLQAETLGLGTCFVSLSQQAVTNDQKCKKILSLPPSHYVYAVLVLGYPQRKYQRPVFRAPKHVEYI